MRRSFVSFLGSIALAGGLAAACSAGSAAPGGDAGANGEFGCCPDRKTGCTLYRYGYRTSATDACIDGHDGVVPDPDQPGWIHSTDEHGCPTWSPPPNATKIECGRARPHDSGVDAVADAPDASDASDATND